MQVNSKVSSTSKDVDPQQLCSAIINVYSKHIARNATQFCGFPSGVVRDLLRVIEQKQKPRAENCKDILVGSAERRRSLALLENKFYAMPSVTSTPNLSFLKVSRSTSPQK